MRIVNDTSLTLRYFLWQLVFQERLGYTYSSHYGGTLVFFFSKVSWSALDANAVEHVDEHLKPKNSVFNSGILWNIAASDHSRVQIAEGS